MGSFREDILMEKVITLLEKIIISSHPLTVSPGMAIKKL